MRRLRVLVGLLLALPATAALACGHCIEDKVAATYDHRVLEEAQRRGHSIAYLEITGTSVSDPGMAVAVQKLVSQTPGVTGASVRVSVTPPAVSFAWDSAHHDLDDMLAAINRELVSRRLELALLRQWDAHAGLR